MPNFASRNHSGALYCLSDSQDAAKALGDLSGAGSARSIALRRRSSKQSRQRHAGRKLFQQRAASDRHTGMRRPLYYPASFRSARNATIEPRSMANQTTATVNTSAKETSDAAAKREPVRNSVAEWAVTILLLLFGTTTLVQAFVIPTGSMEDTLLIGDHLLVDNSRTRHPGRSVSIFCLTRSLSTATSSSSAIRSISRRPL